jgi:hypothetical protein
MILAGLGESSVLYCVCALYLYTFVILGQGGARIKHVLSEQTCVKPASVPARKDSSTRKNL